MAVLLSPIGNDAPFVDSSGNPLSGGQLFTYTAGSTTPQNTYTTNLGNVANSNPIDIGSTGYPTLSSSVVEIWLTTGVNYKFILKSAAGVTLWTRDNISPINDVSSSFDQWVSGPAPTFVSTTSFTLVGDQTTAFHVGRRVKTTNSGGTIYSTITVSAFGAATTVTVVNDSGVLDSGLSAVSYGLLSATNVSLPAATPAGSTTLPAVFTQGDTNTGVYFPAADQLGIVVGGVEVARAKTAGSSFFRRNKLKNASFAVDQRINSATSRADDIYSLDCWYTLTQTAAITVTQSALQENGQPFNIRLTQSQAGAQRMGLAQIVEARDSQADRGRTMSFAARVRISNSQAVRYAILEWTGTADAVTSDVVNDWTSSTYTAGNFFLAANLTVTAVGSMTPSAATWTTLTTLTGTAGSSLNNWVVLVWTEGTAAQNVTLDVGLIQLEHGSVATEFEYQTFQRDLQESQHFYAKSFLLATAAAQNVGVNTGEAYWPATAAGAAITRLYIRFPVVMFAAPTVTLYNPAAANGEVRDETAGADCSGSAAAGITQNGFRIDSTGNGGSVGTNVMGVHWAAVASL